MMMGINKQLFKPAGSRLQIGHIIMAASMSMADGAAKGFDAETPAPWWLL
jgi:hypothetical protein